MCNVLRRASACFGMLRHASALGCHLVALEKTKRGTYAHMRSAVGDHQISCTARWLCALVESCDNTAKASQTQARTAACGTGYFITGGSQTCYGHQPKVNWASRGGGISCWRNKTSRIICMKQLSLWAEMVGPPPLRLRRGKLREVPLMFLQFCSNRMNRGHVPRKKNLTPRQSTDPFGCANFLRVSPVWCS